MPEYFFFTCGRELELLMYVLACSRLLSSALDQFNGSVETTFEKTDSSTS